MFRLALSASLMFSLYGFLTGAADSSSLMTSSVAQFVSANRLSVFFASSMLIETDSNIYVIICSIFIFHNNQLSNLMPIGHFLNNCFLCSILDFILPLFETLKLLWSMLDFLIIKSIISLSVSH